VLSSEKDKSTESLNIIVFVKQVPDTQIIKFDVKRKILTNLHYIMNPADKCALRIAEVMRAKRSALITAVTFGPKSSKKVVRECLTLGADKGIWINQEDRKDQPEFAGKVLTQVAKEYKGDVILCGYQSSDTQMGITGAIIAEDLGLPLLSGAIDVKEVSNDKVTMIKRLKGGSRQIVDVSLPCVITVFPGLERPTYSSLPTYIGGIKRAITEGSCPNIDSKILPAQLKQRLEQVKPRLKKIRSIDSGLSASERIKLLLSSGRQESEVKILKGEPKQLAFAIYEFMLSEGLLRENKRKSTNT